MKEQVQIGFFHKGVCPYHGRKDLKSFLWDLIGELAKSAVLFQKRTDGGGRGSTVPAEILFMVARARSFQSDRSNIALKASDRPAVFDPQNIVGRREKGGDLPAGDRQMESIGVFAQRQGPGRRIGSAFPQMFFQKSPVGGRFFVQ